MPWTGRPWQWWERELPGSLPPTCCSASTTSPSSRRSDRLGGHAHTHESSSADGRVLPIDTGFIVHNDRTYPHLLRLFGELGVETQPTEMSMSVRCDGCGLEYAGARGLGGVFAEPRRRASPAFLRMLVEVKQLPPRGARRLLDARRRCASTLGEFLAARSASRATSYSTSWCRSCRACGRARPRTALVYPARYLFRSSTTTGCSA